MNEDLFIDDGYTATKTIPAQPGLHSEIVVSYRPALAVERMRHRAALSTGDADTAIRSENKLLTNYVVSLNGQPLPASKVEKMKPQVRGLLLDLVLGYAAADEAADAKNS